MNIHAMIDLCDLAILTDEEGPAFGMTVSNGNSISIADGMAGIDEEWEVQAVLLRKLLMQFARVSRDAEHDGMRGLIF